MLDHVTIKVSDYERAKAFYAAALRPLGYALMMEFEGYGGLGAGHPDLWLRQEAGVSPTHVAMTAKDRGAVDAFHAAAMAAGGRDNGGPGVREDYHPTYYAAFVLDPDGHNVEVVCHARPEGARPKAKRARRTKARPASRRTAGARAKRRGRRAR